MDILELIEQKLISEAKELGDIEVFQHDPREFYQTLDNIFNPIAKQVIDIMKKRGFKVDINRNTKPSGSKSLSNEFYNANGDYTGLYLYWNDKKVSGGTRWTLTYSLENGLKHEIKNSNDIQSFLAKVEKAVNGVGSKR